MPPSTLPFNSCLLLLGFNFYLSLSQPIFGFFPSVAACFGLLINVKFTEFSYAFGDVYLAI